MSVWLYDLVTTTLSPGINIGIWRMQIQKTICYPWITKNVIGANHYGTRLSNCITYSHYKGCIVFALSSQTFHQLFLHYILVLYDSKDWHNSTNILIWISWKFRLTLNIECFKLVLLLISPFTLTCFILTTNTLPDIEEITLFL